MKTDTYVQESDKNEQFQLQDVEHQLAEAQAANQHKDVCLAVFAHELRNLLMPIQGGLEMLKIQRAQHQESSLRTLEIMDRQMHYVELLIGDLVHIIGLSKVRLELEKRYESLSSILDHAIEIAEPGIREKNHLLILNLPEDPIYLYADERRLSQMFSNLLINAAKYTPAGGEIRVSARRKNNDVVISVQDNGIGIRKEDISCIFDLFERLKQGHSTGGLGIGLSLAKTIIERHEGSIKAFSEGLGKGTRFDITLPLFSQEDDLRKTSKPS